MKTLLPEPPITRYIEEPDPNNEHEWKKWWVQKMFKPQEPYTDAMRVWMDQCWKETKARWGI